MHFITRNTKIILPLALILTASVFGTAMAEDKPEADLTVGLYSQYIWRGFELSKDSVVIQPSMTVSYKGFGFNLWGNLDTDAYATNDNNFTETDMTLSYDGSMNKIGYGVGYIYYEVDGGNDSQEVYVKASYDTLLNPTLTFYKEITGIGGWYANLGISHSVKLNEELNLDLGASIGYLDNEDTYNELHDGSISASISIPVGEYISVTPELHYTFALSSDAGDYIKAANTSAGFTGDDDSFIYGGVSASLSF
jgi:uncharacterized protein (TIGR02001 family)